MRAGSARICQAEGVLATTHVLTGAVIGRAVRRPWLAAAVGVASHLVLDALPHWGTNVNTAEGRRWFLRVAVADGLALTAGLAAIYRRYGAGPELCGALGALLLDLDKPAAEIGVEQLWPDRLHLFHIGIQTGERPHRWPIDLMVGSAAAAWLAAGQHSARASR